MTFLHRSSPLEGGKTILFAESNMRCILLCEFFYDVLLHIPCPSGILRLARLFRCDFRLNSYDREWLYEYAAYFFRDLTGYDMEDCL